MKKIITWNKVSEGHIYLFYLVDASTVICGLSLSLEGNQML